MDGQTDDSPTAKTKRRYNRIAPYYDGLESVMELAFSRWRKRVLERAAGEVLEVGVGTGKNFPHYPRGVHVTGLDIADRMLHRARSRAEGLGFPVRLMEGDVQSLPFDDETFDAAVATFVFCSVPDPVRGLAELGRVLKPAGRIYLLEHVRIDRPVIGPFMDAINPLVVRSIGANINRRTVENVKKAGLSIEQIENLGMMGMVKLITAKKGGA